MKERNSDLEQQLPIDRYSPTIRSRTTRCSRPRSRPASRRRWTASSRTSSHTRPRRALPVARRGDRGERRAPTRSKTRLLDGRSRSRLRLGRLGFAGGAARRPACSLAHRSACRLGEREGLVCGGRLAARVRSQRLAYELLEHGCDQLQVARRTRPSLYGGLRLRWRGWRSGGSLRSRAGPALTRPTGLAAS